MIRAKQEDPPVEKFIKANLFQIVMWVGTVVWFQAKADADVKDLKARVAAHDENLSAMRDALGAIQLDVALMCSRMVLKDGGDPLRDCKTSGGR